jgi:hypothetical protein
MQPTELTPDEMATIRARRELLENKQLRIDVALPVSDELIGTDIPALLSHADALAAKVEALTDKFTAAREDAAVSDSKVCQTLGAALGMFRFCDDQKNFPGTTEADGVCVGEHVAETLAMEAARRIVDLQEKVARLEGEHRRRRVSEELPPRHAPIVVGFDNGFTWVYDWDGNRRFDWWAPIPKGAAHVARD